MIGCLQTRVRIAANHLALFFEFEYELNYYNIEAWSFDMSRYQIKINILISQTKHMLWVRKKNI